MSIFNSLRGKAARRAAVPTSDLFRIDLGPVEEPMRNGHTERISLTTSERMSLGKTKRVSAQPIGRAAERDFDWKSVQTPEQWREDLPDDPRDEPVDYDEQAHADDRYHHNGYQAAPAPAYAPPPPPAATRSSAPRRSAHAPADVTRQPVRSPSRACRRVSAAAWWCAASA